MKGQGIFSLDVNKILRLQVTLDPRHAKNVIRYAFQHIYAERQPESRFCIMKFGHDDGSNYITFHELNVHIKTKNKIEPLCGTYRGPVGHGIT